MPTYSADYAYLNDNWTVVTNKIGVSKKFIILVDLICYDEDHRLLHTICEELTKKGYVIRRKGEFIKCNKCGSALMSKDIWEYANGLKLRVPQVWSDKCSNCSS